MSDPSEVAVTKEPESVEAVEESFSKLEIETHDSGSLTASWYVESDLKKEKLLASSYKGFESIKEKWKRKVFRKAWYPPRGTTPKYVILYFHGLHEHCGRHGEFIRDIIAKSDAVVFSLDWYAHGHSSGLPGQVPSFNYFIHDAKSYILDIQAGHVPLADEFSIKGTGTESGLPIFLFGHSMGGCIGFNMLLEEPKLFSGAMFSAPLVNITYGQSCVCLVANLLHCFAAFKPFNQASFAKPLETTSLTRDEKRQQEYIDDKMNNLTTIQNKLTWELLKGTERLQALASEIETPVLIMHSIDDPIVSQPASADFFKKLNSKKKVYKKYKEVKHEMFNDAQVMRDELAMQMSTFADDLLKKAED